MLVASILPVANLARTIDNPYHMALAQFIGVDEDYTRFFQERVKAGQFVIMDNGAAEGEQPTIEQLIPKIIMLQPSEIVLPDTIYNKEETLRKGEEAIFVLSSRFDAGIIHKDTKIMVVPHGETFEEWKECMQEMLTWPIDTLGISKFVTPKYGDRARFNAVQAIVDEIKQTNRHVQIHLLGCWEHPREIGEIEFVYNEFGSTVRGTDSAIPYVYAAMGIKIDDLFNRPAYHMDFLSRVKLTDELEELLTHNIHRWEEYCNARL